MQQQLSLVGCVILCEPGSLQRRRRLDERTVWSSQLWFPTFHSTEQRENLAGGKPQQAGIFQNWSFSPLNAHMLWRGPDSQRQKLLSGPRLQGDWKPHPHVSSSQWGKKGLWGQRSERRLLDWNVRMWADLDGRGAYGKAFRSLWEPFWWDVASGLSEALEWCVGRMLPPVCGWPNCPQGSGPQAAASWMDPDEPRTPLPSSSVCWQAGGGAMMWKAMRWAWTPPWSAL